MAENIRLRNLEIYRQRIKAKIEKQVKLYELAKSLYLKHSEKLTMLQEDYKQLDYRIAELDGRLTVITIKSPKQNKITVVDFKKHFQSLSTEKKQAFLESLK